MYLGVVRNQVLEELWFLLLYVRTDTLPCSEQYIIVLWSTYTKNVKSEHKT